MHDFCMVARAGDSQGSLQGLRLRDLQLTVIRVQRCVHHVQPVRWGNGLSRGKNAVIVEGRDPIEEKEKIF